MKMLLSFLILFAFGAQISRGDSASMGKKWVLETNESLTEVESQDLEPQIQKVDNETFSFYLIDLETNTLSSYLHSHPISLSEKSGFERYHSGISPPKLS